MKERLGLLEKLSLRWKGRRDCRKKAFINCHVPGSNEDVVYSAFISTELVRLGVDAREIFNRRWSMVVLRKDNGKPYRRLLRLSEALAQLESRAAQVDVLLHETWLAHKTAARELVRRCGEAQANGAHHMEVLYEGRLEEMEKRMHKEVAQLSRAEEYLLEEEKRILRNTFSRYDVIRSKRFLRIQYYYQAACEVSGTRAAEPLRMASYEAMMDTTIQTHYKEEQESIENRMQEFRREILAIFSAERGG